MTPSKSKDFVFISASGIQWFSDKLPPHTCASARLTSVPSCRVVRKRCVDGIDDAARMSTMECTYRGVKIITTGCRRAFRPWIPATNEITHERDQFNHYHNANSIREKPYESRHDRGTQNRVWLLPNLYLPAAVSLHMRLFVNEPSNNKSWDEREPHDKNRKYEKWIGIPRHIHKVNFRPIIRCSRGNDREVAPSCDNVAEGNGIR